MIVALDVCYDESAAVGAVAAVVFQRWEDAAPFKEYSSLVSNVAPYVPGEFYRRELPCLLAVLNTIVEPVDFTVVDSYVQLGGKPGLGEHLFNALQQRTPIIGVAKTQFHDAVATEVRRGVSKVPLYITAAGMSCVDAANHIREMHGEHRIPTLLKRVDRLARDTCQIDSNRKV
jgi:deoxyribonuclease V